MTWGLCPQTPEVYRFVHERAAGLPCEKERHFCAALPWLGSALRSPLGVAVSSVRAERVYHGLYRFYPHQIKIVLDKGSTLDIKANRPNIKSQEKCKKQGVKTYEIEIF